MDNFEFKLNNKIDIFVDYKVYKSIIQDVTEEYIAISIPLNEGMYIPLEIGEELDIIYYENKELYRFYTKVIGRKVDKIPVILLAIPDSIEKHQRRNFVRVPVIRYIDCSKKDGFNKDIKSHVDIYSEEPNFKATLLDISGGGARVRAKEIIFRDDILLLYIPFEKDEIIVECKVIRADKDIDNYYVCGVTFVEMDKRIREKIVKLTFEVMRDMRKRGIREE